MTARSHTRTRRRWKARYAKRKRSTGVQRQSDWRVIQSAPAPRRGRLTRLIERPES